MASVKVRFEESSGSVAVFEGVLDPNGANGYKFSGKITTHCTLDRSGEDFENTVELGHGGTSGEYTYIARRIEPGQNVFEVSGEGTRAPGETVDFKIGINTSVFGKFRYGDKATLAPGGEPQQLGPWYQKTDAFDTLQYDVRFNGHAWADGPTGYVIRGELMGSASAGTATTQYARFGYKSSSGSWQYEWVSCEDDGKQITIRGSRKSGEDIQVVVGATSKAANLYAYGDEENCTLPLGF